MNDLLKWLDLVKIPYNIEIINSNNKILPHPIRQYIKRNLDLVLFNSAAHIWYGSIKITNDKFLILGPVSNHRLLDIEPIKIFSYLHSSQLFVQVKQQLDASPLFKKDEFSQLLNLLYQVIHEKEGNLVEITLKNNDEQLDFNDDNDTDFTHEIKLAILHGNSDKIIEILNNPNLTLYNGVINSDTSSKDLKLFFLNSIFKISQWVEEIGISEQKCDQIKEKYLNIWEHKKLSPSQTGQLIVEAELEFAHECQNKIFFDDNDPLIHQIFSFVAQNKNQKISREDIANALNISPTYLSHYFKTKTNTTLTTFINEYKVNYAEYLLKATDLSIIYISETLGYSNVTYFNRVFSKIAGQTPSAYRQKLQ